MTEGNCVEYLACLEYLFLMEFFLISFYESLKNYPLSVGSYDNDGEGILTTTYSFTPPLRA
jgi:hypothetical protein